MNLLGLDSNVLAANDPLNWNDTPSFQQAAVLVKSLKVVNDAAERSVALMSSFNQSVTRRESEMQKLIQVVKDNRHRIPDASKSTQLTLCVKYVASVLLLTVTIYFSYCY